MHVKSQPLYVCASGDEIPLELQCNGIAECPGTDDELNCGKILISAAIWSIGLDSHFVFESCEVK